MVALGTIIDLDQKNKYKQITIYPTVYKNIIRQLSNPGKKADGFFAFLDEQTLQRSIAH